MKKYRDFSTFILPPSGPSLLLSLIILSVAVLHFRTPTYQGYLVLHSSISHHTLQCIAKLHTIFFFFFFPFIYKIFSFLYENKFCKIFYDLSIFLYNTKLSHEWINILNNFSALPSIGKWYNKLLSKIKMKPRIERIILCCYFT